MSTINISDHNALAGYFATDTVGATGPAGPQGATGATGSIGATGPAPTGATGALVYLSASGVAAAASGVSTDGTNLTPVTDASYNLGSSTKRWNNLYTADAHFSNEGTEGNSIDGTTGSWTLQEGSGDIFMINNKTGQKHKIKLEEV